MHSTTTIASSLSMQCVPCFVRSVAPLAYILREILPRSFHRRVCRVRVKTSPVSLILWFNTSLSDDSNVTRGLYVTASSNPANPHQSSSLHLRVLLPLSLTKLDRNCRSRMDLSRTRLGKPVFVSWQDGALTYWFWRRRLVAS